MKEKKCKYCAMMIPQEAKICPHCRKRLTIKPLHLCGIIILGLMFLPVLGSMIGKIKLTEEPRNPRSEDSMRVAYQVSQTFVKQTLKAPASANFPYFNHEFVKIKTSDNKNTIYEVSAYVDAQNSFGANIRTFYNVLLVYTPANVDKEWNLLAFKKLK